MLKLDHITKTFAVDDQQIVALKDINLEINNGEFFSIIGPSGCGKSTLLRIIAGLIPASSGDVSWEEPPILSFVFQNFALFPYLTVTQNIEFGLKMNGRSNSERSKKVVELIDEVGLSGFSDKHPKELSGGMKQRVGLARALAMDPTVLLLDEPFSALDEFTAKNLRDLLGKLWRKHKMTVIMITHLVSEAIELSDRIAVMSPLPGSVEEIVDNSLKRPRDLRSKEFFDLEDKLLSLVKS